MGNSNTTLRFVAVAVAVIAVAFCVGYFILGGARAPQTVQTNVVAPAAPPTVTPVRPTTRVASAPPRVTNPDYTAPGAPRVKILEERTPSLTNIAQLQPKPAAKPAAPVDPEASQAAAPPAKPTPAVSPDAGSSQSGTDSGSDTGANSTSNNTDSATPPAGASGDGNTDSTGSSGDSEAGQDGNSGGPATFRVQAGSFAAAKNARTLADALRDRGYVASTRAERDGDKTVYKVQVGAYRTRAAADKAAQDLQSTGYPAYVYPNNP